MADLGNDRIIVLRVQLSKNLSIFVVNVYLPSSTEAVAIYQSHVDCLENIIEELQHEGFILLVGDFNAHIGKLGGSRSFSKINRRGYQLWNMLEKFDFVSINSQQFATGPIETFFACNGAVKTTVDHIFVPNGFLSLVAKCRVLEDCSSNLSYHLPVCCDLQSDIITNDIIPKKPIFLWKELENPVRCTHYQETIAASLNTIIQENIQCEDDWTDNLDVIISRTTDALKFSANSCVPKRMPKPYVKSYWNMELTALRRHVSLCRKLWIEEGKPRGMQFECFSNYKDAKREFRKAQRRAIYMEEVKNFESLENRHDVDRSSFYRKISKKSQTANVLGGVLMENGVRVTKNHEVLDIWRKHYEELCTPQVGTDFDNEFKVYVECKLKEYAANALEIEDDPLERPFEYDEVVTVVSTLPNGKVGGPDNITYEHLKFGGQVLINFLLKIFNIIRISECVAESWTVGCVVSILKSGKKNRMDRGSYRGITLLNVMGKIFERLFLNRWLPQFEENGIPNQFQYAYQNSKSCVLSSLCLQESVMYNVERGSKVYCCFLDSTKAFDTVWLDGLFYKLYNLGIRGKSWRILRGWYNRMKCSVFLSGLSSSLFLVKQGVRQGGVLSPWLFLCYNNDLPEILMSTGYGLQIHDIPCSTVVIADDITLLSVRIKGLQCLLNSVEKYSKKWRFQFNPSKSRIVTFGESTQQFNIKSKTRDWYLNGVAVEQTPSWVHVGILLSGNFSSSVRSKIAVRKGRGVVGALMAAGARAGGLNPICASNLWRVFGLTAMLYGCELWSNLCGSEQDLLNGATTFAAKRFQGLPLTCHSEGALGSLGLWSTMANIEKAKLLFFGNLCRSSPSLLHKEIFIKRLCSYICEEFSGQMGFVPDVIELLRKYRLHDCLDQYLEGGTFPNKHVWRNLVVEKVHELEKHSWRWRMSFKPNLVHLMRTHHNLKPIFHWSVAKEYPFSRMALANLVNLLIGSVPSILISAMEKFENHYLCKLCQKTSHDVGYHFVMYCPVMNDERNELWESLNDNLHVMELRDLFNLEDEDMYDCLISGTFPSRRINYETRCQFILSVANTVWNIYKKVNMYMTT